MLKTNTAKPRPGHADRHRGLLCAQETQETYTNEAIEMQDPKTGKFFLFCLTTAIYYEKFTAINFNHGIRPVPLMTSNAEP